MRNEWNHRQQQQQGFCKELQQYLLNCLHWTTSRAIALKVYRYKTCVEIFSKPLNNCTMLQIGCSFIFRLVALSHTTPSVTGCPTGDAPALLCLTGRQMAKASEECRLPGLLLGAANIWSHLDTVYGTSWLWPHLHWHGGAPGESRCAFVFIISELQQVLTFPPQLRIKSRIVTPPSGVMWEWTKSGCLISFYVEGTDNAPGLQTQTSQL